MMGSAKSKNDIPLEASIPDSAAPLESILRMEEFHRRPCRPPDYEKENRALGALISALVASPGTILQTLAEKVLEALPADSAGLSLLTKDEKSFYWPAIAGAWQPHIGGGTPRDFGPCGDVLDRKEREKAETALRELATGSTSGAGRRSDVADPRCADRQPRRFHGSRPDRPSDAAFWLEPQRPGDCGCADLRPQCVGQRGAAASTRRCCQAAGSAAAQAGGRRVKPSPPPNDTDPRNGACTRAQSIISGQSRPMLERRSEIAPEAARGRECTTYH